MTEREIIRVLVDVTTNDWDESDRCIIVKGGPKYMFNEDGSMRSLIRKGKVYRVAL